MRGRVVRAVLHGSMIGVVCVTTACTLGGQVPDLGEGDGNGPEIVITPEPGASEVAPNTPVRVTVDGGTVSDVRVAQRPVGETAKAGAGERDETASRGTVTEDGGV